VAPAIGQLGLALDGCTRIGSPGILGVSPVKRYGWQRFPAWTVKPHRPSHLGESRSDTMSASTTIAPVEAGTTYPMPPAPSWATDKPDLSEEAIAWSHSLADASDPFAVFLGRSDRIQPHCITVGEVEIHAEVTEQILTVEQAHRLATPCSSWPQTSRSSHDRHHPAGMADMVAGRACGMAKQPV
jgi:hypothetical protein